MDFSEFKRRLGAEPRGEDPELQRARASGPEFAAAAEEAEAFEQLLERAVRVQAPGGLIESLQALPATAAPTRRRNWWPAALAAGLLLAIGAAGVYRQLNPQWESVEAYVADHFHHDGVKMLAQHAVGETPTDPAAVRELFGRFDLEAAPALQEIVGVIKVCVTPDGQGLHMVLDTADGPVTVLYMPGTTVADRERFDFDHQRALLVQMDGGAAAIIGAAPQDPGSLYAFVQDSIRARAPQG